MSAGIALFSAASNSCIILPFFMREPLTLGNWAKSTSLATATNFCKSGKSPGIIRARDTRSGTAPACCSKVPAFSSETHKRKASAP